MSRVPEDQTLAGRFALSIWAHLRLTRPGNVITMFFGAVVGGIVEGGFNVLQTPGLNSLLVLAGVSVAAIGAGGNALNDYFDAEVDALNRPDRPIPSGAVRPRIAVAIFLALSIAGLVTSAQISVAHTFIAAVCILFLLLYNRYLKRTGLVGNLVVGILTAAAILYGGLIAGPGTYAAVGASFALLLTVAREICKDVEDVRGDDLINSHSLAKRIGNKHALRTCTSITILTIALLPAPFLFLDFGGLYTLAILPAGILLLRTVSALENWSQDRLASQLLKGSMIVGMIALVLGRYDG